MIGQEVGNLLSNDSEENKVLRISLATFSEVSGHDPSERPEYKIGGHQ